MGSGTVLEGTSLQNKEQHQGTNEETHLSCLLSRRESGQDEVTRQTREVGKQKVPGPSLPSAQLQKERADAQAGMSGGVHREHTDGPLV